MWYLIVSISDLCILTYFYKLKKELNFSGAPRSLGDLKKMAFFIQGAWGALVIILWDLGSKLIVLWISEPCQKVKDKIKKSYLKGKASILFDFLKILRPP